MTDEQIELAAKALAGQYACPWDFLLEKQREGYRTDARIALEAAMSDAASIRDAALREVIALLEKHDGCPCTPANLEIWSDEALLHYETGQLDAACSWEKAILSLIDNPAPAQPTVQEAQMEPNQPRHINGHKIAKGE